MTNVVNINPQKENGYTPIANELLEQFIKSDFSKRQWAVLMCIARMTYGYNRKSDALSGWQIASMTSIDRSNISKTIAELIQLNVIIKHENGRESHGVLVNELSINKHYNEWLTVVKTTTVVDSTTVVKTTPVTVVKTTTEPLLKQPTLESNKTIKQYMSDFTLFWDKYPSKTAKKKARESWAKSKPILETVLKALEWQIPMWAKDNNNFVPNPTTYINQARWDDEPKKTAIKKPNGVVL